MRFLLHQAARIFVYKVMPGKVSCAMEGPVPGKVDPVVDMVAVMLSYQSVYVILGGKEMAAINHCVPMIAQVRYTIHGQKAKIYLIRHSRTFKNIVDFPSQKPVSSENFQDVSNPFHQKIFKLTA